MRLSHPEPVHSRHSRFPSPAQALHLVLVRFEITTPEPLHITHFHPPIPPHIWHGFSFDPRVKTKIVAPIATPAATIAFPVTASKARDGIDIYELCIPNAGRRGLLGFWSDLSGFGHEHVSRVLY